MELPAFLVEATTLNSDAVMQRKAVRKNFFVIVRKDSLQALRRAQPDFLLEDFLDLSIERILNQLTEADVPQDTALSISGLPAHVATITGTYRGQMVEYRMSVIEGKDYLYQLLVWVPKDEAVRLSPYMDKVIMSFREN